MRLIRAELTRLFARRFTRSALVGVLALLGTIAVTIAVAAQKPTEADKLSAHISATQNLSVANAEYQRCLDQQAPAGTPDVGPSTPTPDLDQGKPRYPPG